jgi:hypothetical protein
MKNSTKRRWSQPIIIKDSIMKKMIRSRLKKVRQRIEGRTMRKRKPNDKHIITILKKTEK